MSFLPDKALKMTFNQVLGVIFLLCIMSFTHGEATFSDFFGLWRSYPPPPTVNILTSQGPALLCRDAVPPNCYEELPPMELTYTLNRTTIALELRDRVGIMTVEESAEAFPECARAGIYPFERILLVPQSKIISYDFKAERIYYIDPRRPDDLNCMPLGYRTGENGPYVETSAIISCERSIPNVFALGLSYRCDLQPQPCSVNVNDEGELVLAIQHSFNLTCIEGNCLKTARATFPFASHAPPESSGVP